MLWRLSVALILATNSAFADPLTFVRNWSLTSDDQEFGGLSGIEIVEPNLAYVLSDRGVFFSVMLDRQKQATQITRLEQPYPNRDSEGLAYAGTFYFSYEDPGSISDHKGSYLPPHPDFANLARNGSLEALAVDKDGTVFTLPERSGALDRPFSVYRYRNKTWEIVTTIPRTGPFLPVGADIGPDGFLYVLKRAVTPLGFRSRVLRLDVTDQTAKPETLLTTQVRQFDNLEGLTLWQSDSGATCLTMVSDNNFLPIQKTQLVEYALTETLADRASCD